MRATLSMACTCGAGPFRDDDLTLSDAGLIRTWTMVHQAPGHTITATVVASYDDAPSRPAALRLGLIRLASHLFPAL